MTVTVFARRCSVYATASFKVCDIVRIYNKVETHRISHSFQKTLQRGSNLFIDACRNALDTTSAGETTRALVSPIMAGNCEEWAGRLGRGQLWHEPHHAGRVNYIKNLPDGALGYRGNSRLVRDHLERAVVNEGGMVCMYVLTPKILSRRTFL